MRIRGICRFTWRLYQTKFPLVRMCIVYDRAPNGVQPGFHDIFQNTNINGIDSTPSILCAVALEHTKRFRVLADWVVDTSNGIPISTSNTIDNHVDVPFDKYVPLKNLEAQYNEATSDIDAISTGGLYFIVRSSFQQFDTGSPPALDVYQELHTTCIRLRYRD